jgi:hypothetical protein
MLYYLVWCSDSQGVSRASKKLHYGMRKLQENKKKTEKRTFKFCNTNLFARGSFCFKRV